MTSVRRLLAVATSSMLLAILLLAGPAAARPADSEGSAGGVGIRYVAGSSIAYIGYSSGSHSKIWKCSFAGWAHVQVNWSCKLKNPYTGTTYSSRSGSFSDGSHVTPWYYFSKDNVYLCADAYAAYNNGSDSDYDRTCG